MNKRVISTRGAVATFTDRPSVIVAIPACNERDRITACLGALAAQVGLGYGDLGIVLFLNNCTDGTAEVVEAISGMPWPVHVIERDDPSASAGWARRIAMDAAAAWLESSGHRDGVLLTTDADSCVGRDWVVRNLAAIMAGADAVAGRISLDPDDALRLPPRLHARGRLEAEYEALVTEIAARLDPEPGNPWPCHWSKSGATLAVRLSAYRRVGGMPDMPTGEDRAFVDAIRAHDLIVRYAADIEVVTSGRLDGRARGGVADTIKQRCEVPDSPCDDRLEKLHRLVARALCRRLLRLWFADGRLEPTWRWAFPLGIDRDKANKIAVVPCFGQVYAAVETESRRLTYRPLRPAQLPTQIRYARMFLWVQRALDRSRCVDRPVVLDPSVQQAPPS